MNEIHIDCELNYIADGVTDFIFNIEAARHSDQTILSEKITTQPNTPMVFGLNHIGNNRLAKLCDFNGELSIRYQADIAVQYALPVCNEIENKIAQIPLEVTPYLWPSRFCDLYKISHIAQDLFGHLPAGYTRVEAISTWIYQNIHYQQGTTDSMTTGMDILDNHVGVCRDFAHLGIAFCRAFNIPARFVSGYAANLKTPYNDFHTIFEVYLGNRWILFDPTRLCDVSEFVRVATGFDAADCAFSTIYGNTFTMTYFNPSASIKTN